MATWKVTYQYSGSTAIEEIQASNLSACLMALAAKERVRPALIQRLIIEAVKS
jgi:hypothetical protein